MVNRAVVIETIKKMYDSGIDDSVVEQTLGDIGLGKKEIAEYIVEAKGVPAVQETGPQAGDQTAEIIKKHLEETNAEQQAMHATTHAALEQHTQQFDEVQAKVTSIEQRLDSIGSSQGGARTEESFFALNARLAALEQQVRDLKAAVNATKDVMEKVLETTREILNKL